MGGLCDRGRSESGEAQGLEKAPSEALSSAAPLVRTLALLLLKSKSYLKAFPPKQDRLKISIRTGSAQSYLLDINEVQFIIQGFQSLAINLPCEQSKDNGTIPTIKNRPAFGARHVAYAHFGVNAL